MPTGDVGMEYHNDVFSYNGSYCCHVPTGDVGMEYHNDVFSYNGG